jgi:hypothetical protein
VKHLRHITSVVLALAVLNSALLSGNAHAVLSKYPWNSFLCGLALSAAKARSSHESTLKAAQNFAHFQAEIIKVGRLRSTFDAVQGSSDEATREKNIAVARRMQGLEEDFERSFSNQATGLPYNRGFEVRGTKQVEAFLSERQRLYALRMNWFEEHAQPLTREKLIWNSLTYPAQASAVTQPQTSVLEIAQLMVFSFSSFLCSPAVTYRARCAQDPAWNAHITEIRARLAGPRNPRHWTYFSKSAKVAQFLVDGILANDADATVLSVAQLFQDNLPWPARISLKLIPGQQEKFMAQPVWLYLDELLSFDSRTNDPVLTVFLRTTRRFGGGDAEVESEPAPAQPEALVPAGH